MLDVAVIGDEGQRWDGGASGAPAVRGVGERIPPGIEAFALLRLDRPAPGIASVSPEKISERATVN